MSKKVDVHWLLKEEPTLEPSHLCDVPSTARTAEHAIILRPVIRQKKGDRLHECDRCATIGKALGIP